MDDSSTTKKPQKKRPRRRAPEDGGTRSRRFLVSYNDAELEIVKEAAGRENQALAAWVGQAAMAVSTQLVVPVSADAKVVLEELNRSRVELSRVGNNLNQVARVLNAEGEVSDARIRAVLALVSESVRQVDRATLQLMRERQPRA